MGKNLNNIQVLNDIKSYIAIDLKQIPILSSIDLCNLGFDTRITNDENYLYFIVLDSFRIFPKLIQLLGKGYEKYLRYIYIAGKDSYHTVSYNYPRFEYYDDQLALSFSGIKGCYLKENGQIIIRGDISLGYVDQFNKSYDIEYNMMIIPRDCFLETQVFIKELFYSGIITNVNFVEQLFTFLPFVVPF